MQTNKTMKDRLDNLINIYLFDLEYDTPQEGDDTPLWQKEREIHTFASRLPKQDLQEIYQKYQKQNKELLSEIEWRQKNQKSSNPIREKVQKALSDILVELESILEDTKGNSARERQKEKIHIEQTISRPPEKKSLVDVAIESGTKIFPTLPEKKEQPIEETIVIEKETRPQTKAISTQSSKKKKAKEVEEIVFEEALSSDDPVLQKEEKEEEIISPEEGKTPEERIEKMVSTFLSKRPKIDWKERDKQEEMLRKKNYEKEWAKKEERQKEEGKKAKTTTLKLWGKEESKKKKSWWPF